MPDSNTIIICPYCGDTQPASERCRACNGLFEPYSRQATHNAMGPWFVRDPNRHFQPGCSYETLVQLVDRGQITKYSILRGPTTKQFWTVARRVPGVAHLLGFCHNCDASVDPGDHGCHACGVPFGAYLDRNFLGLPDVRPLPWEADVESEAELRRGDSARSGLQPVPFRRISSFASDEELLGPATAPAVSAPAPTGSANGDDTDAAPSAASPWSPAQVDPDPAREGTALHAMQRKINRQRATIRTLATIAAALAVVVLLLSVILVSDGIGNGGSTAALPTAPVESGPAVAKQPDPDDLVPAEGAAPAETAPDEPAETAAAPAPATDPVGPSPEQIMVRARAQLDIGDDAARPAGDRIAAYEQALELLRGLSAPDEDLTALIERVDRDLQRLQLQEFFP